jgi:Protein of unknown function (DUF2782)
MKANIRNSNMRFSIFLMLISLAAVAAADEQEKTPRPASAPSGSNEESPDQGPQVTITKRTDQTIEEYRVGGRLYMIKVIPKHGKPYYLVDDRGDGKFSRQDSLDFGVRPPQWVIHQF